MAKNYRQNKITSNGMKKLFPYILILIIFVGFLSPITYVDAQLSCTIKSAKFVPSGRQASDWYKSDNPPFVRVDVVTENCIEKLIRMTLIEIDSVSGITDDNTEINNRPITVETNSFSVNLQSGETGCNTLIGSEPECKYYLSFTGASNFSSQGKSEGELAYDCDGV